MAGLGAGLALALAQSAGAALTGGPDIIAAPDSVADSSAAGGASNDHQQAFDERQLVVLPAPILVDGNVWIPAGTAVNSHMIFFNQPDCGPCPGLSDLDVTWTFNGDILGVMSDVDGNLEAASNSVLGAPGTFYPGAFSLRGLEAPDVYTVSDNAITVSMNVVQPGDWIRVVTEATADDCKHGGWRTSNIEWKNQGDCVSWFATHGKNEPGQNVPPSNNP
jgi:hypothetical protein